MMQQPMYPQPMMQQPMMQPMMVPQPVMMVPQPVMMMPPPPPPPPPPQQQQTIIVTGNKNGGNNGNGSDCGICGTSTNHVAQKKVGMTAILWCLALSTCALCCVPLCLTDNCKDTELICVKCRRPKMKIQANCC